MLEKASCSRFVQFLKIQGGGQVSFSGHNRREDKIYCHHGHPDYQWIKAIIRAGEDPYIGAPHNGYECHDEYEDNHENDSLKNRHGNWIKDNWVCVDKALNNIVMNKRGYHEYGGGGGLQ